MKKRCKVNRHSSTKGSLVRKKCKRMSSNKGVNLVTSDTVVAMMTLLLTFMPLPVQAFEPGFIAPLKNLTVVAGRSAEFTCVVKHLGGHKVAWLRSDSKAILAIHTQMVTNNPRMHVEHNGRNSWTLIVNDVQRNDSGIYMCQINTEPMTSQVAFLNVVEAPDILYKATSNDTIVPEGSAVRLRCEARGYPEPQITWRREGNLPINIRTGGKALQVNMVKGPELLLTRLSRTDMGAYLCIASNGIPSPVSKRIMVKVHFQPLVRAPDPVVLAPLGSNVTLACIVESSPKSVNKWMRHNENDGTFIQMTPIIHEGGRFQTSELTKEPYIHIMRLFIGDVREMDYGRYACMARSALDTARETITLKKIEIPKAWPTTTTRTSTSNLLETNEVHWAVAQHEDEDVKSGWRNQDRRVTQPPIYSFKEKQSKGGKIALDGRDINGAKNQETKNEGFFASSTKKQSFFLSNIFMTIIAFLTLISNRMFH